MVRSVLHERFACIFYFVGQPIALHLSEQLSAVSFSNKFRDDAPRMLMR